jgi:nitrate reductase delta subunit
MLSQEDRLICGLFAKMLDYPDAGSRNTARECVRHLQKSHAGIAKEVQTFSDFVIDQSMESLEELYTQTFDLTPTTSLYFGYHLFGETPKRSEFLVQLTEAYKANSFSHGIELADHLGVMLRFLSVANDAEFGLPLIEECILPTLVKTEKELEKTKNPYCLVISPLQKFLREITGQLTKAGGAANV